MLLIQTIALYIAKITDLQVNLLISKERSEVKSDIFQIFLIKILIIIFNNNNKTKAKTIENSKRCNVNLLT